MKKSDVKGFTLVEMAIVLVIIGLILGMVFKGKELIDGAKVKSLAAQYNKILAATNTFYERYGFYPGDGCTAGAPNNVSECGSTKNGVLNSTAEKQAFWHLLINITKILPAADRKTIFGSDFVFDNDNNMNWLTVGTNDGNNAGNGEVRFICALDKMIDDGNATNGFIISNGGYNVNTDCWSVSGQNTLRIKLLP